MVRNLMVRTLVRENYRVWEADSSAEALHVSNEFKGTLDLLITDHTLKTMTGRQVADHIRQSRPSVKVLHISGYPLETLAREGGLTSGAEFLGKPFSLTDLNQKVKWILARPSGGLFEP